MNTLRFKVALSFPGERRDFVEEIVYTLCERFEEKTIFYDKFHEAELARPNLHEYLQTIYHKQSELIVVFFCQEYTEKEWCGLELRAIQDLIKQRKTANIMFIRFDEAEIPGVFSIDGYVDVGMRPPQAIAKLIIERYKSNIDILIQREGNPTFSGDGPR